MFEEIEIMYSRRDFTKLAGAAGLTSLLRADAQATAGGVKLGAITYSYHDMPDLLNRNHVDSVIEYSKKCDVRLIELLSSHVEPMTAYQMKVAAVVANGLGAAGAQGGAAAPGGTLAVGKEKQVEAQEAREELRKWRLATPMSHFKEVKKKMNDAGITVYAYTVNSIGKDFTSDEMDKVFEQAQTLGASTISSSTTLSAAQKVARFAEKHNLPVAFHNHQDITDTNQFSTPDTFYKAMEMSKLFRINLDIGYLTGTNFDAVEFIEKNHERITHLHVKDRKKNLGPSVPWGEGDTPVKDVLLLLKKGRYPIPAIVELSYPVPSNSNCIKEVTKCMAYMKQILA
jgi:sugar phosphate isomerase/epimerase